MMRIVFAASASATTTSTATTINPTTWDSSLRHDERRGAPNLDHFDVLPGGDHLLLVERARGPHLAADLHRADALVVRDALEHERRLADQRGGAGANRRRAPAMTAGDRAQQQQEQDGRGCE